MASKWASLITIRAVFSTLIALNVAILFGHAEEKMVFVSTPKYIELKGGDSVRVSQFPDLLSSLLGFTKVKNDSWSGIDAGNPLKRPEAVVVLQVEGLDPKVDGVTFPLEPDVEVDWTYQLCADRIYVRFSDKKPTLLHINDVESLDSIRSEYSWLMNSASADDDVKSGADFVLMDASLGSLNLSHRVDNIFISKVKLVADTTSLLANKSSLSNGVPDLFWFRINGGQLVSSYGKNSLQVEEASEIISKLIKHIGDSFNRLYEGNLLFVLLNVESEYENLLRVGRSLLASQTEQTEKEDPYKISAAYDEMYPAVFNMVLLVSLVFWLSVFAVSIGIWNMDPGRDSIIYRMTSQRMKKDQ